MAQECHGGAGLGVGNLGYILAIPWHGLYNRRVLTLIHYVAEMFYSSAVTKCLDNRLFRVIVSI